jgi:gamma-glutamylcyclotransferase (GGCT)/AIG2-like uncharacterized protein YtfP
MTINIFVYGTLQPGHRPYQTLCQKYPHEIERAIVYGELYHLPIGYPAIITGGDRPIYGHQLRFQDPEILKILDDYEQHDPIALQRHYPQLDCSWAMTALAYDRQSIATFSPEGQPLEQSWAYTMTIAQIQHLQGQPIPNGKWPPTNPTQERSC